MKDKVFVWLMWLEYCSASNMYAESEDPYPSLSDFHDYEPNLEFDDTELEQAVSTGNSLFHYLSLIRLSRLLLLGLLLLLQVSKSQVVP